ncbi:hypothetical protein LP2241_20459 [Pseudolactococcus piscium]|nr:hypothetical protein LP2241_20459 [Lactococcus piscium]
MAYFIAQTVTFSLVLTTPRQKIHYDSTFFSKPKGKRVTKKNLSSKTRQVSIPR